jgi:hypothetical protein
MITENDILTDAQVAKLAGFKLDTFQRRMRKGFKPGELDWNKARPIRNGDRRWWFRPDVEKVIKERMVVE